MHRKRIMIIGQPGSGKSTLARQLGDILSLPVVHVDLIHWQSGWIERGGSEKDRLCSQEHAKDTWIFEGGRSQTWDERLARADTLIWLDFPLAIRAWRILKRRVKYRNLNRPDLPAGCPERINWEFTHFVWRTRKTARSKMKQFFAAAPMEKDRHRLSNRTEVDAFVTILKNTNNRSLHANSVS